MQTVTRQTGWTHWARHLGKMTHYGCMSLILACSVLWGSATQAQTVSCTTSGTPNLVIGSVNVLAGTPAQTSASFSYTCSANAFPKDSYVIVCFNINDGSAGSGNSYNPRRLAGVAPLPSASRLNFDIYQNSSLTLWGTQSNAASGNPAFAGPFGPFKGKLAFPMGSLTLVSTVIPLQNTALAGNYSSDFTGATSITWLSVPGGNVGSPPCAGATAVSGTNSFGFNVTATVSNQCYVTTSDLNFGPVSSLAAGPITGQSTVNVQCTNGTPYTVGLSNGLNSTGGTNRSMKNTATATLVRYELYQDAGRSVRWGNNNEMGGDTLNNQTGTGSYTPITIYGQAYPDASTTAGNYADTVTVTLYY